MFALCLKLLICLQYLCKNINIWFENGKKDKNKQFHEMFRDYWFHLEYTRAMLEFKIHQKSGNPGNFHEISFRIIMLIVYLILKMELNDEENGAKISWKMVAFESNDAYSMSEKIWDNLMVRRMLMLYKILLRDCSESDQFSCRWNISVHQFT